MPNTNYPDGVTNCAIGGPMQTFPAPDPSRVSIVAEDFLRFNAGAAAANVDWGVVGVSAVVPTVVAGASYGKILFAPVGATDSTYILYQGGTPALPNNAWAFQANKELWFKTKLQISNALNPNIIAGLFPNGATPLASADGVFFVKAAASATMQLKAIKTAASNSVLNVATMVAATEVELGFHYSPLGGVNAAGAVYAYLNDSLVGSIPITNVPAAGTALTFGIGILNATAAATMTVDYIQVATQR